MAIHVVNEARRCLNCKVPQCRKGCPINTPIPDMIRMFLEHRTEEAGQMVLKGDPFCVGVIILHRECRFPSGYMNGQARRRGKGIALHMVDGKYVISKVVLSFQILIGRVSPVVDGTKSVPQFF